MRTCERKKILHERQFICKAGEPSDLCFLPKLQQVWDESTPVLLMDYSVVIFKYGVIKRITCEMRDDKKKKTNEQSRDFSIN